MNANNWNSVELRDNRYNHIVHMVSAANGAEDFYSTEVRLKMTLNSDPIKDQFTLKRRLGEQPLTKRWCCGTPTAATTAVLLTPRFNQSKVIF
jgi:hypothetical protein